MLPKARKALSKEDLETLGERLEEAKKRKQRASAA